MADCRFLVGATYFASLTLYWARYFIEALTVLIQQLFTVRQYRCFLPSVHCIIVYCECLVGRQCQQFGGVCLQNHCIFTVLRLILKTYQSRYSASVISNTCTWFIPWTVYCSGIIMH